MAALLVFLVVCSVGALVVAIYAANKPVGAELINRVDTLWGYHMDKSGFAPVHEYKFNGLRAELRELARELRVSEPAPFPPIPTLADRLAALEAKKGKK